MLATLRETVRKYAMLAPGDGVIVGLSGGADSVVLLAALLALGEEYKIYAVHVNHNLRGEAAHQDEGFARLLCESWGVPFFACQADTSGYAAENKLGIEEAGRKLRYEFLREKKQELGATKIAVGHNQDDVAETVLMNLFRGAGLKGLAGIPPINGDVIRPLINVSRNEIETYAAENGLAYVHDQSNFEVDYNRNYLRNEIMPLVRGRFGDGITGTIARNAQILRGDEEALTAFACDVFHELARVGNRNFTLPIDSLLSYPDAIVNRVLRLSLSSLRGMEDITATHVQSVIDIAKGRTGREVSLPGVTAGREYEHLIITSSGEDKKPDFCHDLIPGVPVEVHGKSVIMVMCSNLHVVGAGSSRPSSPQKHSHARTYQQSANDISSGREDPHKCQLSHRPSCRGRPCVCPHNNTVDTSVHNWAKCTPVASSGRHKVCPYKVQTTTVSLKFGTYGEDPAPTNPIPQYYTQAFNYDKVNQQLKLRTRRPGDKITLPGGTKKLQDYFTDTKTPKSMRDQIPLVADGENILWIMDKHNRTNTAYQPKEGQNTCWITIKH